MGGPLTTETLRTQRLRGGMAKFNEHHGLPSQVPVGIDDAFYGTSSEVMIAPPIDAITALDFTTLRDALSIHSVMLPASLTG